MIGKLLITGGAGFIGSAVIRHLIRTTDAKIINVDKLTYAATPEALEDCVTSPRYTHIHADIADASAMRNVFETHRPDAVMHLAAESHVDRSIDGPAAFVETNVVGTYTLLEAARAYWQSLSDAQADTFRFHHVSTDEVYGSLTLTDSAFSETTPYAPNSPYSATKAASDHLVRAWGETYGLPVITSNCSNNYGPWQFPEKLIPVTLINARDGRPLPVYGAGENIRDWLFVEDHAQALWLVLNKGRVGETYNVGGNAERTNLEVVNALCEVIDAFFPGAAPHAGLIEFVPDRPGHDLRYAIDASKIRDELGWRPTETFETGFARTVAWYLAHEGWWREIRARTYDGRRCEAMKTLVIGTNGQLGRALGNAAPDFICLDRSAVDLLIPNETEATIVSHAPDLIINAAAYTAVDQAETDTQTAFAINRDGVAALARGAARTGAALVHVSTDYVFDGAKTSPWTEDDTTNPLGIYGTSKLAGETVATAANPRTLILRTSWLYSPWGRNFVTTMLRVADRERLSIVDDQLGNPTSAQDLATAIIAIAPRLAALPARSPHWGVYHYAGRGMISWAGFAREIFTQAAGKLVRRTPEIVPIPAAEYPSPTPRPANSALDCSAFERDFGIEMIDWRDALAQVLGQIAIKGPKKGAVA